MTVKSKTRAKSASSAVARKVETSPAAETSRAKSVLAARRGSSDAPSNPGTIDFNRSSDKKATASSSKSKAKPVPAKYSTAPIESQGERDAFAKNFRVLRKEVGLSQRDIQKLTGIAQSHVSEIESGMHNICIETMAKLARLVNKPVHELLKP
jgi:DNA-binding XRE family transcriptional regulator